MSYIILKMKYLEKTGVPLPSAAYTIFKGCFRFPAELVFSAGDVEYISGYVCGAGGFIYNLEIAAAYLAKDSDYVVNTCGFPAAEVIDFRWGFFFQDGNESVYRVFYVEVIPELSAVPPDLEGFAGKYVMDKDGDDPLTLVERLAGSVWIRETQDNVIEPVKVVIEMKELLDSQFCDGV